MGFCNNISQDKHRVDLFGAKSQREGILKCLQRFLPSDKLHEDDGLSRYICRSCEMKILAFLKKEQELKTLFIATEYANQSACEGEQFKQGRGICMAYTLLMNTRNRELSMVQKMNTVVIGAGHATEKVL